MPSAALSKAPNFLGDLLTLSPTASESLHKRATTVGQIARESRGHEALIKSLLVWLDPSAPANPNPLRCPALARALLMDALTDKANDMLVGTKLGNIFAGSHKQILLRPLLAHFLRCRP